MALLTQPRTTPPGGYVYLQPETQTRIESRFGEELVTLIIAHRQWKGLGPLDRETVWLEAQRQICAGQEPGICRGEPGENYNPLKDMSRRLTIDMIQDFSRSIFSFFAKGAQFVSEAVAQERGTICLSCPYNRAPSSCSCTPLWRFLETIVPASRKRDNLHICGICGCALQAKHLMPDEVIRESNKWRGLKFPDWCWQKELV